MNAALLLILAASVLGQLPQQKPTAAKAWNHPSTVSQPAFQRHNPAEITVPFEYYKQHIYIAISVDDTPGLIFMLDSGANENILNLRTARQLKIKMENIRPEKNVGFANGGVNVAGELPVRASVGPIRLAHSMTIMDLSSFERHFDHPTDGMLGAPFFYNFVVKMDFQKKLLTVFPAEKFHYRGAGESIKLSANGKAIVLPVTLGNSKYENHHTKMEVDTGSNVSLLLYRHCVHPLHLEQSELKAQTGLGYGVNGDFACTQGVIDSLWIGRAETYHIPVDYFEPSQAVHPKCGVAGAIGNEVLQSFQAVIFDVPHGRLIFEINRPPLLAGVATPKHSRP